MPSLSSIALATTGTMLILTQPPAALAAIAALALSYSQGRYR